MKFEKINLPDLGVDQVEIIDILVKIDEFIKKDQILIIVESDKATIEIPSNKEGKIKNIFVKVGDIVLKNDILLEVITNINDINLNKIYKVIIDSNYDFLIKNILVKIGDLVKINDPLISILFNKTDDIIYSNFEGKIIEIYIKNKDILKKKSIIFSIDLFKLENEKLIDTDNNLIILNKFLDISNNKFIYSSPSIRKLAKEMNIDLSLINGSGNKGRILYEDIYKYLVNNFKKINIKDFKKENILNNKEHNFDAFGKTEKIEIKGIKKISGEKMYYNWTNIPHVTQFDYIDITSLEEFRKKQNKELEKNDYKISLLSFIIKSVSEALKKFNIFNSSISKDKKYIILKKYINIGFAVDTNHGLMVPVIKNTYIKNITTLSKELIILSKKAHNKELTTEDISGGTFTISSLGSIGNCDFFNPIINFPEVSILGISKFNIRPIWNQSEFIPRLILPVSLSYDHRIINGADSVKFINYIKNLLEDCRKLLI